MKRDVFFKKRTKYPRKPQTQRTSTSWLSAYIATVRNQAQCKKFKKYVKIAPSEAEENTRFCLFKFFKLSKTLHAWRYQRNGQIHNLRYRRWVFIWTVFPLWVNGELYGKKKIQIRHYRKISESPYWDNGSSPQVQQCRAEAERKTLWSVLKEQRILFFKRIFSYLKLSGQSFNCFSHLQA